MARRTVLLGVAALLAAVALVVVITRDGRPELELRSSTYPGFAPRGGLVGDRAVVRTALEAWQDDGDAEVAPREDLPVQILFAGEVEGERIVLLAQPGRTAAIREVDDGRWKVTAKERGWEPFQREPLAIGDLILVPQGRWRYVPLSTRGDQLVAVNGLFADPGGGDDALIVEADPPRPRSLSVLWDSERGAIAIDAATHRKVLSVAGNPPAARALHGALIGADLPESAGTLMLESLWLGEVNGGQAAVAEFHFPAMTGLGVADDADGGPTDVLDADLGARPTGGVGAIFLDGTLVAAAAGKVERLEIRSGGRTITRDGPVVVLPGLPVDGTVVTGLDARGDVVGSLTPRSR